MPPKAKEKGRATEATPTEDLFSAIHRHAQASEYDQVVGVADQVLALAPGDEDAVRCKIVALIKSDAIDKALVAIRKAELLPIDLTFYKAYCFYRQNKLSEALDLLSKQENSSMVLQLESQIYYRQGRMDSCMDCHEKLKKFNIDSFDYKSNVIASLIAAGRASEVHATMDALKVKASSSFELAYNTACSLIEKGKYADAEQQLLSARRIGQEMLLEDECAEDEVETELAPISVQLAYIRQLQGHSQESLKDYMDIVNRNLADPSSLAVATNNLIAVRGTKDATDSLKRLDKLVEKSGNKHVQLAGGLDFKLFPRQKEAICSNRVLLLLHANKVDQAQELVSALLDMFPDSATANLLQAAVFVRGKRVSKAEEILSEYAEKHPKQSKLARLALSQIAATSNHFQICASTLSKVPDIQHMPATVATLVSLHERLGDLSGAASVFDAAIQWWSNAMTEESKLSVIMQEAATFRFNHGHHQEAFVLYEELVKSHDNIDAVVGLIMTAAHTDIEKAEFYEKKLKPLSGLKGINVQQLEEDGLRLLGTTYTPMDVAPGVTKKQKMKKRKRKPRYPKGFDPANPGPPPDPERWLPKRERSSYRPKRKDKRAQIRGSQGAVSREKHDSAGTAAASSTSGKSAPAAASSSKSASSSEASKASSKSKKKKPRS